ncbi:MAG: helix-turn-helix domain-containing protein [Pseudomonadota bacterium]|jgi:excisionase family DNA binding protein
MYENENESAGVNIERVAISVSEFCTIYGVGKSFLYEELKSGRLKARKVGARTLIPAAEARAWWASKKVF